MPLRNLTFRSLEYVITLAEEGNFTKAANRLYITQPSLSQAIKRIEQECDVELFYRAKNRVILTDQGRHFLETGRKVLEMMDGLEQEICKQSETVCGHLTIGAGYMLGAILVPRIVASFRKQYPYFSTRLVEAPSSELERSTVNGDIDVCFLLLPVRESALYTKPLLSGKILLVMSKNNPLNQLAFKSTDSDKMFFDLKKAYSATFIRSREGNRTETINEAIFQKAGFSPNVSMQVRNIATALHLVCNSNDLFLLPDIYYYGLNFHLQYSLNTYYLDGDKEEWTLVAAHMQKGGHESEPMRAFLGLLDKDSVLDLYDSGEGGNADIGV